MASRVVMPKLSDTMEEGRILRWLKQEGDQVETGQALAEVETDKATVEMEAYTNGVLRKLVAKPGDAVAVGALIAVIGSADEDISALLDQNLSAQPSPVAGPAAPPLTRPARPAPSPVRAAAPPSAAAHEVASRTLRASPLALRMAAEAGIDLAALQGSGPQGRVVKRDIETALAKAQAGPAVVPAAPPAGDVQDVELSRTTRFR